MAEEVREENVIDLQSNEADSGNSVTEEHDDTPVFSELAENNPKFLPIAKQFVVRLDEQLVVMRSDLAKGQFDSLSKHAHWLKGSGGTVGFSDFKDPALALEIAAKENNANECDEILKKIAHIRSRVRFSSDENASSVTELNSKLSESTVPVTKAAKITDGNASSVDTSNVSTNVDPVYSRLPMENPRFRELVERFIPRLEEQLTSMRKAVHEGKADDLKQLAHWMKGSGGNVGFDQFVQLGASLEQLAVQQDYDLVRQRLDEVDAYFDRIKAGWQELPPLDKTA